MRTKRLGFISKTVVGFVLTMAFTLAGHAASDTRRGPRMSEMSAADCTKIGAEPISVCVRWETSTQSKTRAAQCIETKQMCSPR